MNFLKNNKRFSFNYNGKSIWEMPYKTELEETENTLTTVYYFHDGLKVTNIAKKYDKGRKTAVVWFPEKSACYG